MTQQGPQAAEPVRRRSRAVGDEQKEARRRQILLAAKRVFADQGFEATTMAAVAKAARLSYGAVYWYFASKDELFHAVMALEEEALRSRIAASVSGDGEVASTPSTVTASPATASTATASPAALGSTIAGAAGMADAGPEVVLGRAVRATFEFFEEDRAAVKLLFRDSYAMGGRFESHLFSIYERFIDDITAVLVVGQRQGAVIAVPPRVAAFSVAALIGQLAHRRLTTDDGLDSSVVADFVVRLVLDGLRPRPPAAPVARERAAARQRPRPAGPPPNQRARRDRP